MVTLVADRAWRQDKDGKITVVPPITDADRTDTDRTWKQGEDGKILATIPVSITSCSPNGGTGTLRISGNPGGGKLKVTVHPRKSGYLTTAMLASLGASLALALFCWVIVLLHGHKLRDPIDQANWDFSTSWASNITAFGSGLTFLLNLTILPDKTFFGTKGEYTFLASLATALVALAPAFQRLMSPTIVIKSDSGDTTSTPQGLVGGFLVASVFTLWGAFLQIALELLVLQELALTVTIDSPIEKIIAVVVSLTAIGLIFYSVTKILSAIGGNPAGSGKPITMFSLKVPEGTQAVRRPISAL